MFQYQAILNISYFFYQMETTLSSAPPDGTSIAQGKSAATPPSCRFALGQQTGKYTAGPHVDLAIVDNNDI